MLNSEDLKKMQAHEVANLADVDYFSVRKEGERRQDAAAKKIERLKKQLAAAQREMEQSHTIIKAALREQAA